MSTTMRPRLTIQEIETVYVPETELWTAWLVGNSRIWGTGKTEVAAINDMWIYQGLLAAEGAVRIAEGRQVWQEMETT